MFERARNVMSRTKCFLRYTTSPDKVLTPKTKKKFEFTGSVLVLAAGMPRSASTWLYNAVRLLITSSPSMSRQFSCGWIGDWRKLPKRRYMLLKIHGYNETLVNQSESIVYSYRDIRDVMASRLRKFGRAPSIEFADSLIRQYEQWMGVAEIVMRYESMLIDKESIINQLARLLDLQDIDSETLLERMRHLSYESPGSKSAVYHSTNLYHKGHITDGRPGSWKGILDVDFVKQVEERHLKWFEQCGYPLDSG